MQLSLCFTCLFTKHFLLLYYSSCTPNGTLIKILHIYDIYTCGSLFKWEVITVYGFLDYYYCYYLHLRDTHMCVMCTFNCRDKINVDSFLLVVFLNVIDMYVVCVCCRFFCCLFVINMCVIWSYCCSLVVFVCIVTWNDVNWKGQ